MKTKSGISVVLLAYHEAENLRTLLPKIIEQMNLLHETYEIIVVDTKEPTDDTSDVCKYFHVQYIAQEKPGFGGAFCAGIEAAQFDKYITLDSDGSHDPIHIRSVYDMFTNGMYDVVIGSRYVRGGYTEDKRSSVIMSRILNFVFRVALGIKAKDISTSFRMYKTDDLKRITLQRSNYDVLQEVLVRLLLLNKNLKIAETPISFHQRMLGESKRRMIPFIIDYGKSLIQLCYLRHALFRNVSLYFIFGVIAMLIEYAVFSLLSAFVLPASPELSNVIAAITGFVFTFFMNTFVNFKKPDKFLKRLLSYSGIVIFGIALSTGIIHLLKDTMNLYLLKGILLICVSGIQFILNKYITYRD